MEYYAHSSEDGTRLQTVAEHLKGTAEKCRAFAAEFSAEAIGEMMGETHDKGKCTEEFQDRLLNDGPKVDHSTAGASCGRLRALRGITADCRISGI